MVHAHTTPDAWPWDSSDTRPCRPCTQTHGRHHHQDHTTVCRVDVHNLKCPTRCPSQYGHSQKPPGPATMSVSSLNNLVVSPAPPLHVPAPSRVVRLSRSLYPHERASGVTESHARPCGTHHIQESRPQPSRSAPPPDFLSCAASARRCHCAGSRCERAALSSKTRCTSRVRNAATLPGCDPATCGRAVRRRSSR